MFSNNLNIAKEVIYANILGKKKNRAGEPAQSVKCFSHKHEDLDSIST